MTTTAVGTAFFATGFLTTGRLTMAVLTTAFRATGLANGLAILARVDALPFGVLLAFGFGFDVGLCFGLAFGVGFGFGLALALVLKEAALLDAFAFGFNGALATRRFLTAAGRFAAFLAFFTTVFRVAAGFFAMSGPLGFLDSAA